MTSRSLVKDLSGVQHSALVGSVLDDSWRLHELKWTNPIIANRFVYGAKRCLA